MNIMFANIKKYEHEKLEELFKDFLAKGGALRFHSFVIERNYRDEMPEKAYQRHLLVARQTLEEINYQSNFHNNKEIGSINPGLPHLIKTDHELLNNSGKQIKLDNFFGYLFDVETKTIFVRGRKMYANQYFEHTTDEIQENIVNIQERINLHESKYEICDGNFTYAFMEPPFSLQTGETLYERGEYFNNFIQNTFDDISKLEVFTWSKDCHNFFDAGKEWWGSYFWTVYNPTKNIYLGIVGSETD